jgi:hypothetical protein
MVAIGLLKRVSAVVAPFFIGHRPPSDPLIFGEMADQLVLLVILALLFKAFYHWGKAKGYRGGLAALGALAFPFSMIVMAYLKDRVPEPPSIDDPVRKCPACGLSYKLGDYDLTASHILCSGCKAELPRA